MLCRCAFLLSFFCLSIPGQAADLSHTEIGSVQNLRLKRADWTGFSGVLSVGSGVVSGSDSINWDVVMHSGVFAASAGYDREIGRLVVGGHVEGYLSNFQKTSDSGAVRQKAEWLAAATLRLGYDAGRFMPYLTAGLGAAKYKFEQTKVRHLVLSATDSELGALSDTVTQDLTDTGILFGPVFGGGLEATIQHGVFVRVDYKHFHFNKQQFRFHEAKPFNAGATADLIDIGVGYRF